VIGCALRAVVLGFALVAGCGDDTPRVLTFVDIDAPDDAKSLVVRAEAASDARAELLAALDARDGAPRTVGAGAWRTAAIVPAGATPDDALRDGHVYARRGGDVRLEVSVSQGPLQADAAGLIRTQADRVMLEVHVADPSTRGAQFRLAIHADARPGGIAPVDVTPDYLRQALPAGRYRARLEVPASGARWIVGVTVLDDRGDVASQAWASCVGVER